MCDISSDLKELLDAYRDAWRKLGAIHELAHQAQVLLVDHHIDEDHNPNVKELLVKIAELSQCV